MRQFINTGVFVRHCIALFIIAGLIGAAGISSSAELFGELGVEGRYCNGETTYHISFDEPWSSGGRGESELEFPIDCYMAGVNVIVGNRYPENPRQTQNRLSLTWLGVIHDRGGVMKDSDWIENDAAYGEPPHTGRDLYTESDAELKGMIVDAGYSYLFRLNNILTLGPMIGYRYHDFKYDIYGYRGIYWNTPVSGEGQVLEYKVTYRIPYVGLSSELSFGKKGQFQLHLTCGYSDWVEAEDRDDHLLRSKLSEGDCEGEAWLASLTAGWKSTPHWAVGVGGEYIDIETRGTQYQSWYAGSLIGTTVEVDDVITSSFWSALIKISYVHRN